MKHWKKMTSNIFQKNYQKRFRGHWGKQPYPKNKDGFINEEEIFKLAYGILKLPYGLLDDIMPFEIGWLFEQHMEDKKDNYEMIAYSFRAGYISAQNGKPIKLFEDKKEEKNAKLTAESKADKLEELNILFN